VPGGQRWSRGNEKIPWGAAAPLAPILPAPYEHQCKSLLQTIRNP